MRNCIFGVLHRHARQARHEFGFALAHEAGIDIDAAHALGAEGARAQSEGHGGIDAAADEEEDVARANAIADLLLDGRSAMARVPILHAAANAEDEVRKILDAARGVDHFGVKLDSVELPLGSGDGCHGARSGAAGDAEAGGQRRHRVAMVHPDLLRAGEAGKQGVGALFDFERGQAVLAFVALAHRAAERVRHDLLAIADAHDGAAERENGGVDRGAGGVVDAARAAGDDDAASVREFGGGGFAEREPRRRRPVHGLCGR